MSSSFDLEARRARAARDAQARLRAAPPRARPPLSGWRDPRALAALCYALPVVPAGLLLWRERHNRFVRFHAAQSLILYGLVGAGQLTVYALLVVVGELLTDDTLAVAVAVALAALFLAQAGVLLVVWFRLVTAILAGRARPLPVVGSWAVRLLGVLPA